MDAPEQLPIPSSIQERQRSEDQALVAAIQRKDRKATAEFVSKFADGIYRYVQSRLAPRADLVDDLVQEVFLAAWGNLAEFRGTSSLEAWLLGIARHKVEDYYRARLREPEALEETEEDRRLDAQHPDFDDLLDVETARQKISKILAALPEKYRVVLMWRYWEKTSAREMSARTGKTEKAIERLLARARDEFRWKWTHEQ